MIALLLVVGYFVTLFYHLRDASLPSVLCTNNDKGGCYGPLTREGDQMSLELWVQHDGAWEPVDSCRIRFTVPKHGSFPSLITTNQTETTCSILLPRSSRIRQRRERLGLQAKFRVISQRDELQQSIIMAEIPFELTRFVKKRSFSDVWNSLDKKPQNDFIPHYKYSSQSILIRFVSEYRQFGGLPPIFRRDGFRLTTHPWIPNAYQPILYVDDSPLQHSAQAMLAPPSEHDQKPPVTLRIKLSNISPFRDTINRQVILGLSFAEGLFSANELDELRYWLRDERLYRLFLTQLISYIHLWLDYMAFRDEIRFYKGRTNFVGVSTSTVITRFMCSIIIFLYILDSGNTSWVVLLSMFGSVAVDGWKMWKILHPTLQTSFPFVSIRVVQNPEEERTAEYDRVATTYLGFIIYPVVLAWSIYDLQNNSYRSLYSWLISNLANAVYTFGFIALCPQLYINYRLKSVAHLPWKVFLYKIFNTFVDDIFAFLIDMPWKHRIMTLRDDVIFFCFLVQAYLYRVDKSRTNEYGYSYGSNNPSCDKDKLDGSPKPPITDQDNAHGSRDGEPQSLEPNGRACHNERKPNPS